MTMAPKNASSTKKRPSPPSRPKQECRKSTSPGDPAASAASTSAHFDVQKREKRAVVYVEIGENLQKVMDKAIQRTYEQRQGIANLMRSMGVDMKEMVQSAVKMEVPEEDISKTKGTKK